MDDWQAWPEFQILVDGWRQWLNSVSAPPSVETIRAETREGRLHPDEIKQRREWFASAWSEALRLALLDRWAFADLEEDVTP